MNKFPASALGLLLAPLLALSCVGLVACGQAPSGDKSAQTTATSPETPVDPTQKFIGTFKLAAAEYGDVMLSGDMSSFLDGSSTSSLEVKADSTGSVTFAGSTAPFDWKLKDDNTLDLMLKGDSADKAGTIMYADDALKLVISDNEQTLTLYFSADGTYSKAKTINMDQGTAITNEADLLGTWKITGATYNGASAYGSAEALSNMGMSGFATVTFESGGVVKINDSASTYTVDASGTTLTSKSGSSETSVPVKKLGDDLMIDATGVIQGTSIVVLLSK